MFFRRITGSSVAILALIAFCVSLTVRAEQAKPPADDVPAEKYFKNIKVFQGLPSTKLDGTMDYMSAALNVRCGFCHVASDTGPWPMEKDDKAAKRAARDMIEMTRAFNEKYFNGRMTVTCATCHRGVSTPEKLPPFLDAAAHPIHGASEEKLPRLADVLAKYVEALGGRETFSKLKTLEKKGSVTRDDGKTFPIAIDAAAPDRYRFTLARPGDDFVRGFDGRTGWEKTSQGVELLEPDDLAAVAREALFDREIRLKEQYAVLAVTGIEKIESREAYSVLAKTKEGERQELYFDRESGLLVRRVQYRDTALGAIPSRTDYSDYRTVAGIRLPFVERTVTPDRDESRVFSEIRANAPLDDAIFTMPKP